MASAAHKRRHKHEEHEEHVNHERWLVSYADMLTVLMALFIVLFALSQVDQLKFAQFKEGFETGTSSTNVAVSGSAGVNDSQAGSQVVDLAPLSSGQPLQQDQQQEVLDAANQIQTQSDLKAAQAEVAGYRDVEDQINSALTAKDDQDQVTYRITSDGLVIGLVADNVFFASGSADVEPKGQEVLDTIAPILAKLSNNVAVQGHTNSVPLNGNSRYRDNWDLSTSRANTVVTRFIAAGIAANRLSSSGYADSRPLYPDSDPRALAGNRRVDLVVASPSSDAVKALLPQVAQSTPTTDGVTELSDTTDTQTAETATSTTDTATTDVVSGVTPDLSSSVAH